MIAIHEIYNALIVTDVLSFKVDWSINEHDV